MGWTTDDIPDQRGRVAVVTGANGGLGLASATALARAGAHVVLATRDQQKAAAAHAEIVAAVPDASLEVVELDLASLAQVERAAAAIAERHDQVHLLLNNAGLMAMPFQTTTDGFESQWGVNVLGHWALTSHLLPILVATPGARVVWVSSVAQHQARGLAHDPQMVGAYDPWAVYSQTKLADRLLAEGLQHRFEQHGVDALSLVAHPGFTDSDLQQRTHREGGGGVQAAFFGAVTPLVGMSTAQGALSQLRAATDPSADPARQYCPLFTAFGPPVAKPMVRRGTMLDAERLFALAAEQTGLDLDVA